MTNTVINIPPPPKKVKAEFYETRRYFYVKIFQRDHCKLPWEELSKHKYMSEKDAKEVVNAINDALHELGQLQ